MSSPRAGISGRSAVRSSIARAQIKTAQLLVTHIDATITRLHCPGFRTIGLDVEHRDDQFVGGWLGDLGAPAPARAALPIAIAAKRLETAVIGVGGGKHDRAAGVEAVHPGRFVRLFV